MLTFVSRQVPFSITGFCMEPAADLNFNQLPQSTGVTVIKKKKKKENTWEENGLKKEKLQERRNFVRCC